MLSANGDVMPVPQMVFNGLSYSHIVVLSYINEKGTLIPIHTLFNQEGPIL